MLWLEPGKVRKSLKVLYGVLRLERSGDPGRTRRTENERGNRHYRPPRLK